MKLPPVIVEEVYKLLCAHGEEPKMGKDLFISWYPGYVFNIYCELKTMNLYWELPFRCYVDGTTENAKMLDKELDELSTRCRKIIAFW